MNESEKKRSLMAILGQNPMREHCGVMDRERIKRMWEREKHQAEDKIEPYYGNLVHLKDVEKKEFWLNDEELEKWIEQEEKCRKEYLKESFIKGLRLDARK